MRVVVLISIVSCRLESCTCCTYLCVEHYESAEPVKEKVRNHRSYQAIGECKLKLKYSLANKHTFRKL